jgi:hypothetical protein
MPKDALSEAQAAEVDTARRAERLQRARDAWAAWSAWWKRRARELAVAAKISAAAAGIVGSWKVILLMRARNIGRAEMQSGGSERMAADRVDKPPQGGK